MQLQERLPLCGGIELIVNQALGWDEVLALIWGVFGVLQLAKVFCWH